jgi:WD40-like Beta Propeller Repeat
MRGAWRTLLLLLCACKAEIGGGNPADLDGGTDSAENVDAVGTFGPWSAPMLVMGASSAVAEDDGTLSNSKLEMIFAKADPAVDAGRKHLYWMSRTTETSTTWSMPLRLAFNIDGTSDETPRFSADDKTLFFASGRAGGAGQNDIWSTTRPTVGVATGWLAPTRLGAISSTLNDKWCMPCAAGRYLMISSRAPSTTEDVYEGTTGAAPTLVTELSSNASETGPYLSPDCLTMYFASNRSGANRIYKATRTAITSPWSAPQIVPDFMAIGMGQEDPWLSDDQRTFVFSVLTATANKDVYITTR